MGPTAGDETEGSTARQRQDVPSRLYHLVEKVHKLDPEHGYSCELFTLTHPLDLLPGREWTDNEELGKFLVQNAALLHIPDIQDDDDQWWAVDCVHTFKDGSGEQ